MKPNFFVMNLSNFKDSLKTSVYFFVTTKTKGRFTDEHRRLWLHKLIFLITNKGLLNSVKATLH